MRPVRQVSPATFYRRRQSSSASQAVIWPSVITRALAPKERQTVHDTLNSERFVDQAPTEVYATLLRVSTCARCAPCIASSRSIRAGERRDQLRHPNYEKPVLLATGPNQVWSWDITKLLGPMKWVYFHLYVILDIFSRYVVGWMLAERESAELAKRLIKETCSKQGIVAEQLTLHADRGTSMKSKPLAMLLSDLGVTKTHSRPQVSNDNPYSESQFKTLKYRPEFPKRFGSIQHARDVCRDLFGWYNTEHYHSGIGLLTPESVHYGRAAMIVDDRRRSPAGALGLLRSPSGAFCEWSAETARNTLSGVDQSADDENDASDWRTSRVRGLLTTARYPSFAAFTGNPLSPTRPASVTRTQHNHAQTQGNPA